jgi:hypothetical protein
MKAILFSIIVLVSVPLLAQAQVKNKRASKDISVRLVKNKPSVYITFERYGKREPLEPTESSEGIWLRLHNNTRWELSFCAFGVSKEYGEIGMFYDVEEMPFEESGGSQSNSTEKMPPVRKEKVEPPIGYKQGHACTIVRLTSGKSILFSVPREHLADGLAIKTEFNYGWEDIDDINSGLEPEHNVYFYSTSLPPEKSFQSKAWLKSAYLSSEQQAFDNHFQGLAVFFRQVFYLLPLLH